jgi:AraC-like DNA-binding protein
MYRWKESELRLNQHSVRVRTHGASFTVHYWGVQEKHYSNFLHKHSFFEVCYVLDGFGSYMDNGVVYPLLSGTLFYSRPGIMHQIMCEQGMQLLFVAFEFDEDRSGEAARDAFQQLAETDKLVLSDTDGLPSTLLWKSLLVQARHAGAGSSLSVTILSDLAGALLFSFASLFNDKESQQGEQHQPQRRSSTTSLLLQQAKLYVTDNVSDDDLSLSKVAAHLNISQRHLSRLFSAGIGESFTGYVRMQRVRQAAELLQHSEMSVKAIAEVTGFGSVHYFTRTFRELMSDTPAHFRENSR